MSRVLALDPGSSETGWVIIDHDPRQVEGGKMPNARVLTDLREEAVSFDVVLIEYPGAWGIPIETAAQAMETLWWSGRFAEAAMPVELVRVTRDEVKRKLLDGARVKSADSVIRGLLIDRYAALAGDPLGGKAAAIGTKAKPGPLHGIKADAWAALALAVAYLDGAETLDQYRARKAAEKAAGKAA